MIIINVKESDSLEKALKKFKKKFEKTGVVKAAATDAATVADIDAEEVGVETGIVKIKRKRADAVMAIQQEISMQLNKEKIGKNYKTLFDRKEGDYFIGRTEFDSPDVDNEVLVKANNDTYIRIGDFENVRITDASDFDLYGELIKL